MGQAETKELLEYIGKADSRMVRADLHVHTTVSDGSLSFAGVLAQAQNLGLTHLGFTNHDTTQGLDSAIELGESFGITVVPGIEISAWDAYRKRKVHVLGYGLRDTSSAVEALCAPVLARRNALSHWQLDRLIEAGYAINVPLALAYEQASTALYKQHLMAALTGAPHESDEYKRLYRSLFKGEGICARDIEYVDARDAVRAIVEDGGVPVLAHPGQLDSYGMVDELVSCGLCGIERFHPDHDLRDWAVCNMLADRYGLICTGGSDYHGAFGDVPHVGYGLVEKQRPARPDVACGPVRDVEKKTVLAF